MASTTCHTIEQTMALDTPNMTAASQASHPASTRKTMARRSSTEIAPLTGERNPVRGWMSTKMDGRFRAPHSEINTAPPGQALLFRCRGMTIITHKTHTHSRCVDLFKFKIEVLQQCDHMTWYVRGYRYIGYAHTKVRGCCIVSFS